MTSDAWVTIIATVLAAFVTAIIARFEDVVNILRRPSRLIAGDWEGASYLHPAGVDDTWDKGSAPPDIKYIVNLTQRGRQVKGVMTMTEAPSWILVRKLNYTGKIVGNHFVYEASSTQPEEFRFSTATGCSLKKLGKCEIVEVGLGYVMAHNPQPRTGK